MEDLRDTIRSVYIHIKIIDLKLYTGDTLETIGIDVIGSILAEYAKRIVDKALKGEMLSDWEVGFLLMEATRRTLEARMDAIEKRMSSLEESLKTRIEAVEKRMESLEESMSAKIEALEKRVEALEKRIEAIEKRIDSIERRIESLENDMRMLRSSIDSIRDTVIIKLLERK